MQRAHDVQQDSPLRGLLDSFFLFVNGESSLTVYEKQRKTKGTSKLRIYSEASSSADCQMAATTFMRNVLGRHSLYRWPGINIPLASNLSSTARISLATLP